MDDAIHTLSGTPVTALQAEQICGINRVDRADIFHCPECYSIVFLCKEGSPYFRHQPHRGEHCKRRIWSSGHSGSKHFSTSDESVKVLAQRLLDAMKVAMGQRVDIPIDPAIDRAVAAALMGREMLPPEGLDKNAASVLYHPYFSALLRWILACIRKQTNTSAMKPQILAAFVQQQYFKPLITESLRDATRGGKRVLGGLEPLQLSESPGTFEFEVLRGTGRPRIVYKGDTIDCVRICSSPCVLLFRAHPEITLVAYICDGATGHAEERVAEICDQGWRLVIERPTAAVISLCKLNSWADPPPPLLYISSEWQPGKGEKADLRSERRMAAMQQTAAPLPAVRAAELERWNGRTIASITGFLLLLAIILSHC